MNFQIKVPFCIKPNSIKSLKNWNWFLTKDIVKIKVNQRLKEYDIKDTKLTVMQDTTDLKAIFLVKLISTNQN
jgi:hypothetical protein